MRWKKEIEYEISPTQCVGALTEKYLEPCPADIETISRCISIFEDVGEVSHWVTRLVRRLAGRAFLRSNWILVRLF